VSNHQFFGHSNVLPNGGDEPNREASPVRERAFEAACLVRPNKTFSSN
jgi:hypothetical protein